jgi:hypothetical protein
MVFESFLGLLNPIFFPLVNINQIFGIAVIALIVAILISLAHKFMTDQHVMKQLKSDMKKLQKKMRQQQKNPEKMLEIQQEMLEKNKAYMGQSMRPMLITMIPLFLIIGWISAHLVFAPIEPGTEFDVQALLDQNAKGDVELFVNDSSVQIVDSSSFDTYVKDGFFSDTTYMSKTWTLVGEEGIYDLTFVHDDTNETRQVWITAENEYFAPEQPVKSDSAFESLNVLRPKNVLISLPFWPLENVGGIGTYIIFSIIFSLLVRRLMKLS